MRKNARNVHCFVSQHFIQRQNGWDVVGIMYKKFRAGETGDGFRRYVQSVKNVAQMG